MNDKFHFYVPAEIIKAADSNSGEMRIGGIASTDDKDLQEETLMNGGFDLEYFKAYGLINWHHQLKNNPKAVIGVPDKDKTMTRPDGLYVEAVLYKGNDLAVAAYEQTSTMAAQPELGRTMGWSIEGKVTERDPSNPKIVRQAQITGIALTPMPINPRTFAQVLKGFTGDDENDFDKAEDGNGGEVYTLDHSFNEGGYIRQRNDGTIILNLGKAMTTESARPIIKQGLEREKRTIDYGDQKVVKSVLTQIFKMRPDLTPEQALAVYDRISQNQC